MIGPTNCGVYMVSLVRGACIAVPRVSVSTVWTEVCFHTVSSLLLSDLGSLVCLRTLLLLRILAFFGGCSWLFPSRGIFLSSPSKGDDHLMCSECYFSCTHSPRRSAHINWGMNHCTQHHCQPKEVLAHHCHLLASLHFLTRGLQYIVSETHRRNA